MFTRKGVLFWCERGVGTRENRHASKNLSIGDRCGIMETKTPQGGKEEMLSEKYEH